MDLTIFIVRWKEESRTTPGYCDNPASNYHVLERLLQSLELRTDCANRLPLAGNQKCLAGSRITDEDVMVISRALGSEEGAAILQLDLSYNSISDEGALYLADYLKYRACSLKYIDLRYNEIGAIGATALSESLQINSSVNSLLLDGNKIGHDGGMNIASMLQVNVTITRLSLANTDLDTDSVIAFATILRASHSLFSVDLSRPLLHSLQEDTTHHLGQMLEINTQLTELVMRKHNMTDTGVEVLCRFLKRNHALATLDISCNKLSRDGAGHIANLLTINHYLTVLDVGYNRIEDEGIEQISSVLAESNYTLVKLNICSNSIGDRGVCKLAVALQKNLTLSTLFLWGNRLGEPACDAIHQLLQSGRLSQERVDVRPYVVDGVNYVARYDARF